MIFYVLKLISFEVTCEWKKSNIVLMTKFLPSIQANKIWIFNDNGN